jgi:hypothetical protein
MSCQEYVTAPELLFVSNDLRCEAITGIQEEPKSEVTLFNLKERRPSRKILKNNRMFK